MTKNRGSKPCARCGKSQPRERLVYSRFTKRYYCGPLEMGACTARLKKLVRREKAAA